MLKSPKFAVEVRVVRWHWSWIMLPLLLSCFIVVTSCSPRWDLALGSRQRCRCEANTRHNSIPDRTSFPHFIPKLLSISLWQSEYSDSEERYIFVSDCTVFQQRFLFFWVAAGVTRVCHQLQSNESILPRCDFGLCHTVPRVCDHLWKIELVDGFWPEDKLPLRFESAVV